MKPYAQYREDLGARESRGNGEYACVNHLGYVGKFQFGLARLCDLGLTRRIAPGFANHCFEWIPPNSQESFLANHALQDRCFDRHVALLKAEVEKLALGGDVSGSIAVCHLLGPGGLIDLLEHGIDREDANGTKASSYLAQFSGYEIP